MINGEEMRGGYRLLIQVAYSRKYGAVISFFYNFYYMGNYSIITYQYFFIK